MQPSELLILIILILKPQDKQELHMIRSRNAFLIPLFGMLAFTSLNGVAAVNTPLNYKAKTLDGKEFDLSKLQGKVVLVVNVASACGYTGQYKGMQAIFQKFEKQGLVVLGVPSNEFGAQEPGSNTEIADFCQKNYGVTFPVLEKQMVKGANASALYKHLTSKETNPKGAGDVKWNFTKFLIGKNGEVLGRYEPDVDPEDSTLVSAIEAALKK